MCKIKTAAAYIRVSTADQTELSPDSQIKVVKKYAEQHGYFIPEEFLFRDDGISGRHADRRPGFNAMIAAAKQTPSPFRAVLLWKFSRFARNQEESIFYKSVLRRNGVDVISVSEPSLDGPFGTLIERIIEWSDEYYSIRLSGEVRRGMTEKAERGGAVSIAPFGYKIINKKYVTDVRAAGIVKKIFADFLSGKTTAQISDELNLLGVKTNQGNCWEKRGVEYILRNPVYTGKIRWNTKRKTGLNFSDSGIIISDGIHSPVIDCAVFDSAQKRLDALKKRNIRYSREKADINSYMLRGLVKCSSCGASLTMSVKDTALQCCNYIHGKCSVSHYISLKKINESVIAAVEAVFKNNSIAVEQKSINIRTDYNNLISKEIKKLSRIKVAYENGAYTLEEMNASKKAVDKRISHLTSLQQAANSTKTVKQTPTIPKLLKSNAISEADKRELLRSFISKIVFDRKEPNIRIYFYL